MKKSLLFSFSALLTLFATGQNVPVDFEPGGFGATWTWTVFENATNPAVEIIANPDPTGINTSATVAKFTALQGGQPYAGCETMHGADIGMFTINDNNKIIKIMVWKSVISDVGIKLVRADNWSLGEIKVANTMVNQWEELTFDFSAHLGNVYDQIVVFPDFTSRAADRIIYFDNIFGGVVSSVAEVAPSALKMFPNPVKEELTLQADQPLESLAIYSAAGALLWNQARPGYGATVDVSLWPRGMYLTKASINGQVVVSKFVKN
ncbi:MAG: hypothetical protein DA408_07360 [Bacteroidetes bacterium]|nr:MAG: hypothetical protein C7N36_19940 [Bacteroidota bacterium]PTM13317.1 MAG: hypothetical protein DA408_07360 [Bacteroidota bacterium]